MKDKKGAPKRLNFPLLIFLICLLFTFMAWDHFFNSTSPIDQNIVSHLILVMGTILSAGVGLFARAMERNRVRLEEEVSRRTAQLQKRNKVLEQALQEIRVLRGFIPICVSCKKIRNDQGFWEQIEEYLQRHSDAQFSHGMCKECMHRHYPDYSDRVEKLA